MKLAQELIATFQNVDDFDFLRAPRARQAKQREALGGFLGGYLAEKANVEP
jgi:hypothetical protein